MALYVPDVFLKSVFGRLESIVNDVGGGLKRHPGVVLELLLENLAGIDVLDD